MKTYFLSTLLLFFGFGCSLAQELTFEIIGSQKIQESYDADNKGTTLHEIKLKITRIGTQIPTFDIPVSIVSTHLSTSNSDFQILNPSFIISSQNFNNKGAEFTIDIFVQVNKDNEFVDSGDELFTVGVVPNLVGLTAPFTAGKVRISGPAIVTIVDAPKKEYQFDPFRITVGANFDFEKTISATFYFDAQAYRPNIWYGKGNTSGFGVGFYGSLYNNKYITQDSVQIYQQQFQETIGTGDTVNLVRYNYQIGVSNAIKNIGAEGGLLWGWEHQINPDTYVSTTFILPEISAIHRRVTSTYSYDRINVDTLFNIPAPDSTKRLVERGFNLTTYDEVLLGAGYIGRFHSKKHGEFMFKFTSGLAVRKSASSERDVKAYYAFRFQLLDPKIGVNLGGEVRGYYGKSSPYFGVYLSKSFGLKKLTEY
jgi:hypothetical protein